MSSSWIPGAFGFLAIIIIGILIPLTVSSFIDIDDVDVGNSTSILNQSITLINDGFPYSIPIPIYGDINGSINPFERPLNATSYLSQTLRSFALIPTTLLIGLMLIIIFGIGYSVIAFLRGI